MLLGTFVSAVLWRRCLSCVAVLRNRSPSRLWKPKSQATSKPIVVVEPVVDLLNSVSTRRREQLDIERGQVNDKDVDGRTTTTRALLRQLSDQI